MFARQPQGVARKGNGRRRLQTRRRVTSAERGPAAHDRLGFGGRDRYRRRGVVAIRISEAKCFSNRSIGIGYLSQSFDPLVAIGERSMQIAILIERSVYCVATRADGRLD